MELTTMLIQGFRSALWLVATTLVIGAASASGAAPPEKDRLAGPAGELEITFLGHASLLLGAGGPVVYVDPYGKAADYAALPKADIVLITHEHQDHLDQAVLQAIRKKTTRVVASVAAAEQVNGATPLPNGASISVGGVGIEAVPAYNIKHERSPGVPFHPKGRGNGSVLTMAGLRVYVAGDTENTPEMKRLAGVDVAFLPMNLPYTMTPEMAADAARMISPKILYPYHFGESDTAKIVALLKDRPGIEVRVRRMP
jgi:L-ascorbate metabolism protein UlaG (beta-lactamase superfamily)